MFWNQTLNKLLDLNDKSKASLRNRLSEVKFLIISEFSMVSSDLWRHAASKLGEIYNDTWKGICWSFSHDCRGPDSANLQSKGNLFFHNFQIKIVWNNYLACSNGIYLNMQNYLKL